MTGLELLVVAYVCVGLGCGALLFHVATGGWDHYPERDAGKPGVAEAGMMLDLLRMMRTDRPGPFGTIVGILILIVVLVWPIPAVWVFVTVTVPWLRWRWAEACRCEDCRPRGPR